MKILISRKDHIDSGSTSDVLQQGIKRISKEATVFELEAKSVGKLKKINAN